MFGNIYEGKKVLVTGDTGFKGSWLSLWLENLGATVTGYSLDFPTHPNHSQLLNLKYNQVKGDVLDYQKLSTTINSFKPDIIFHLAAQPLVRLSYQEPIKTFATNIMGTANLLEAVRNTPSVKAVVNITTDKVYENKERSEPYKEDAHLGGYDPYSASKAGSEIVTSSYAQSFFHPDKYGQTHQTLIASARSGNVIGGGDWAVDRLIPDIVRSASHKKKVLIRNPESTRPWQHVLEPLSGYLLLGSELIKANKTAASAWNFGPNTNQEIKVKDLLMECQKLWPAITYQFEMLDDFHEAKLLQLDSTKAKKVLGWENVWNYPENIALSLSWYRSFYENNRIESQQQLKEYSNHAKKKKLLWTK